VVDCTQGALIYLELMLKLVLERDSTIAHVSLPEFLHLSLQLSDKAQALRGRGNFTEVSLLGNGLGRLLHSFGLDAFWAPRKLFPRTPAYGTRRRAQQG